jgi:hypothetical protein
MTEIGHGAPTLRVWILPRRHRVFALFTTWIATQSSFRDLGAGVYPAAGGVALTLHGFPTGIRVTSVLAELAESAILQPRAKNPLTSQLSSEMGRNHENQQKLVCWILLDWN